MEEERKNDSEWKLGGDNSTRQVRNNSQEDQDHCQPQP